MSQCYFDTFIVLVMWPLLWLCWRNDIVVSSLCHSRHKTQRVELVSRSFNLLFSPQWYLCGALACIVLQVDVLLGITRQPNHLYKCRHFQDLFITIKSVRLLFWVLKTSPVSTVAHPFAVWLPGLESEISSYNIWWSISFGSSVCYSLYCHAVSAWQHLLRAYHSKISFDGSWLMRKGQYWPRQWQRKCK